MADAPPRRKKTRNKGSPALAGKPLFLLSSVKYPHIPIAAVKQQDIGQYLINLANLYHGGTEMTSIVLSGACHEC